MDFDDFVGDQQASLLRTAITLMGGDLHSAEDLVQTALARCWLRWRRIGRMDYPHAYAQRVLYSVFIGEVRRKRLREVHASAADASAASETQAFDLDLAAAIRSLPPRQRAVIVARYLDDLTETETAYRLGCSVGTVKSQTFKALRSLQGSARLASYNVQNDHPSSSPKGTRP